MLCLAYLFYYSISWRVLPMDFEEWPARTKPAVKTTPQGSQRLPGVRLRGRTCTHDASS